MVEEDNILDVNNVLMSFFCDDYFYKYDIM